MLINERFQDMSKDQAINVFVIIVSTRLGCCVEEMCASQPCSSKFSPTAWQLGCVLSSITMEQLALVCLHYHDLVVQQ